MPPFDDVECKLLGIREEDGVWYIQRTCGTMYGTCDYDLHRAIAVRHPGCSLADTVNHPALKDGACSGAIRCQPNPNGPVDQTKALKRR